MVRQAEWVRDANSLRDWLEGKPQDYSVVIAYRSMLRVLPLWCAVRERDWSGFTAFPQLALLRSALTLGVAGVKNSQPLIEANRLATAECAKIAFALRSAPRSARAATESFNCCVAAAQSLGWIGNATEKASKAAAHAFSASALSSEFDPAGDSRVMWSENKEDAVFLESNRSCIDVPIWQGRIPPEIRSAEGRLKTIWGLDSETWDFWLRWWQGAQQGRNLDWEIQERIALIPAAEWDKDDPARIAQLIREIEKEFASGTVLSRSHPFDFTFDALARIMRLVGLDDDAAHLTRIIHEARAAASEWLFPISAFCRSHA